MRTSQALALFIEKNFIKENLKLYCSTNVVREKRVTISNIDVYINNNHTSSVHTQYRTDSFGNTEATDHTEGV